MIKILLKEIFIIKILEETAKKIVKNYPYRAISIIGIYLGYLGYLICGAEIGFLIALIYIIFVYVCFLGYLKYKDLQELLKSKNKLLEFVPNIILEKCDQLFNSSKIIVSSYLTISDMVSTITIKIIKKS